MTNYDLAVALVDLLFVLAETARRQEQLARDLDAEQLATSALERRSVERAWVAFEVLDALDGCALQVDQLRKQLPAVVSTH